MNVATLTGAKPASPEAPTTSADLAAIKARQHAAWSSGDYAVVGTTLQIVGEELCEALDLRSGRKVLDVAAGNGMGDALKKSRRREARLVIARHAHLLPLDHPWRSG